MTLRLRIMLLAAQMALSPPCFAFGWFGNDLNGHPCAGSEQGYGPFDYTNPTDRGKPLHLVEMAHFTPPIENLMHGRSGKLGGELNYTLMAFPNHHRALYSVIRYALNYKKNTLQNSPECYLQRAIKFKPDDAVVHMLYGIYLHKKHKYKMAMEQYLLAEKLEPHSPELHYNLGLLYFDLKNYPEAVAQARRAYAKGYPLPGLKEKLKSVGVWQKKQEQNKSQ